MAPEGPDSSRNTPPADLSTLIGVKRMSPAQRAMLRMLSESERPVNCHLAVYYLEKGTLEEGGEDRHKELREFQLTGYDILQDPTVEELAQQIRSTDFPCIVAPSTVYDSAQPPEPMHTFVAFQEPGGEIVLWEKSGFDGGYQTRTLKEAYDTYAASERPVFWRTRKFKTP